MRPSPRPEFPPTRSASACSSRTITRPRRMAKNRLPEHGQVRSRRRPRPLAARLGRPAAAMELREPRNQALPRRRRAPAIQIGALQFVNRAIHHLAVSLLFAADVPWPVNGGADNIRYSPSPKSIARMSAASRSPGATTLTTPSKTPKCRAIPSLSTGCSMPPLPSSASSP